MIKNSLLMSFRLGDGFEKVKDGATALPVPSVKVSPAPSKFSSFKWA